MDNNIQKKKLRFSRKLGYAIGQMTDSVGFNVFYFFFLYFLTDFAGIPAGIAGTISLIAILWDAVTDPIIGHISDNLKSKYGRRRPLMIGGAIPYAICTFLIFNNIDFSNMNIKFTYFVFMAILFWSCYKIFVIPFFALGAELTEDFNERTSLRAWASVFMYLAVMLASAAPPMIVEIAMELGLSSTQGWQAVGLIFGVIIIITAVICWNFTRGGEIVDKLEKRDDVVAEEKQEKLFKSFLAILKLRPIKFLAVSVLGWSIVSAMVSSGLVFIMSNNLNLAAAKQSTVFMFMTLVALVWIPIVNGLSNKIDKRIVFAGAMLFSAIGMFSYAFIGIESFNMLLVFVALFTFGNTAFWTLYYSMMYDISELDEFINGQRREGIISALMSFAQKLGSALAVWMTGIFLSIGGYDGALKVQTEGAHQMILWINTLIPAIFGVIAVAFAFGYPLTGERFEKLMVALKAKRSGKEYTTDGFEKLL